MLSRSKPAPDDVLTQAALTESLSEQTSLLYCSVDRTLIRENLMRRVLIAVASTIMVTIAAGLLWSANATPMGLPSAPNYSQVEKVGCGRPGRCPWGSRWACGPYGRCGCIACGYGAPRAYVAPRVYVAPRPYVRVYPRVRVW